MHRFNTLAAPLKVVWMVIPNKTTVYLDPAHAQAFVQRANELQVGPDLFAMAQDMRRKMVDLYWPNDTHWSMQGQLYFGQRMLAVDAGGVGKPGYERAAPMNSASTWLKTFVVGFAVVSAMLVITLFTPAALRRPVAHRPPVRRRVRLAGAAAAGPGRRLEGRAGGPGRHAGGRRQLLDDALLAGAAGAGRLPRGHRVLGPVRLPVPRLLPLGRRRRASRAGGDRRKRGTPARRTPAQGRALPDHAQGAGGQDHPVLQVVHRSAADAFNWDAKLTTGVVTYRNTQRAKRTDGDTLHGKDTQVRLVPDGCQQFSHKLCDRALFFKEDVDNGPLTAETFELLKRYTASQSLPLIWMVIPNKTTVYIDQQHSKPFVEAFRAARLRPRPVRLRGKPAHAGARLLFSERHTHLDARPARAR